ncbi:MAG: hypothetical protein RIF37_17825 [Rhodospirillaceae bacterium]
MINPPLFIVGGIGFLRHHPERPPSLKRKTLAWHLDFGQSVICFIRHMF